MAHASLSDLHAFFRATYTGAQRCIILIVTSAAKATGELAEDASSDAAEN
jgi:hypothetical protein